LNNSRQALPLAEGALLAVITGGLFLASYYLPLIGILVGFICPLPIIVMVIKHEFRYGLIVVLTASFLVTIISGPLMGVIYLLAFAVNGLIMGETFKRQYSPARLITVNTLVAIVTGLILIGATVALLGKSPLALFDQELTASIDYSLKFYEKIGLEQAQIKQVENTFSAMARFVKMAFPALFVITMALNVLAVFLVSEYFLGRLNFTINRSADFSRWRLPDVLIWFFIAGFLLYLSGVKALIAPGLNLLVVMAAIYFIQGLSIVQHYFKEKAIPRWGRIMFYGLLLLSPMLAIVVVLFSVFDLWLNFRRITLSEGELS